MEAKDLHEKFNYLNPQCLLCTIVEKAIIRFPWFFRGKNKKALHKIFISPWYFCVVKMKHILLSLYGLLYTWEKLKEYPYHKNYSHN